MAAEIDMVDIMNNPFIDWTDRSPALPNEWRTDDVAHSRAYRKLRFKVNFYELALKEINEVGEENYLPEVIEMVKEKLQLWKFRLHQAIYN